MKTVLDSGEIFVNVMRFAKRINGIFPDSTLTLISIINGGIPLGYDLAKALYNYYDRSDIILDTICLKSYKGEDRGKVEWEKYPSSHIKDQTIILVDDINDSGNTLIEAIKYFEERGSKRVFTCVMLERSTSKIKANLKGKVVEQGWFIGYGMDDHRGHKRNLTHIYVK